MQPSPASPIPLPDVDVDSDVPVTVIPAASVAPLDGPPDGERINTFAVAPAATGSTSPEESAIHAFGLMRDGVLSRPLTYVAVAFSLGLVLARVLR